MVGGLPNSKLWNIEYNDLVFKEVIGKGNFGNVYRGSYLGVEVAIKQIPSFDDPDYCKYTEREVKALRYIRHPQVVHFFGACHHTTGFYLITEFVDGPDVRQFVKCTIKPPRWTQRVSLALSVAQTCFFLHSKNIIHRDLKTKNVLMTRGGAASLLNSTDHFKTKLCDFGFARVGSQYSTGCDSSSSDDDSQSDVDDDLYDTNGNGTKASGRLRRMSICGTPSFMAPEILLQKKYDWSVDVFSYGVILAELITFKRPGKDFWVRNSTNGFDINVEELKENIAIPNDCPTVFYDLCIKCCQYEPSQRPKFSDIIHILEALMQTLETENGATSPLVNGGGNLSNSNSGSLPVGADLTVSDTSIPNIYPITVFKDRKRQTLGTIANRLTSNRKQSNAASTATTTLGQQHQQQTEREGVLKLPIHQYSNGWKEFGVDGFAKVWIVYHSNMIRIHDRKSKHNLTQLIEVTPARVIKISKNSMTIAFSDPNIANGTPIINVKPYYETYPHVQYIVTNEMKRSASILTNGLCLSYDDKIFWKDNNELVVRLQSYARRWLHRTRYNRFKSSWSTPSTRAMSAQELHGQQKQWIGLVDQLITSEHDYRRQLDYILKSYLAPLQSKFRINKPLLNYKEIASIFSNIETIYDLHTVFISTLKFFSTLAPFYTTAASDETRSNNAKITSSNKDNTVYQYQTISQFFIKNFNQMKNIYGKYMYNFKYAMNTLSWCRLNPDFASFTKHANVSGEDEFDLAPLLSLPINRIQKYQLLFENLTKCTPLDHPENKHIAAAFSLIKEISSFLQNQLEMSVNYSSIMSIETMLLDDGKGRQSLMQSGRWFVKQGALEETSSKQKYYIYLLSDLCLITKPFKSKSSQDSANNQKYYYREKFCVHLKDPEVSMKFNPDVVNGVILNMGLLTGNKCYRFVAASEEEANEWVGEFERTISNCSKASTLTTPGTEEPLKYGSQVVGSGPNNNNDNVMDVNSNGHHTETFKEPLAEKEKGFIKRLRQKSVSSGSPDRRESLAIPPTPSTPIVLSSSASNTPTLTSANNSEKKKFSTFVMKKFKRLSVNFSAVNDKSKGREDSVD
ncbi:hypothetical protein SAMD00019534_101680 [Acytostelium subglobosum LB1]|uniref:hypothetical protein n=1 Tax=Acytostelium subglobosum LB1 TaxID=1410327 RepID=UPI000644994C|nr:hypothetical protein SAMD00019534_101680 [Acytostelium subglobosum LB1]GAM26993.1 hypothetical protein SAMD00019534_101680 [Acytostelium subglobosum LB1]|eukprot:XP_012749873.1 hypothetical protein SAMD00019534_101680 [Acytostelium subglobosum LB1]